MAGLPATATEENELDTLHSLSRNPPPCPLSPRILLSPSSPDFPAVDLPLPVPEPTSAKTNKKLRQSLLLLDTRLAELKTIAHGGGSHAEPPSVPSQDVTLQHEEAEGPVDFMLARGSFSVGKSQRDLSSKSLASVESGSSSHRSSEDAFDIVDFPSIEQFALSPGQTLGLASLTRLPPSPRDRPSDMMAFPIPPSEVIQASTGTGQSSRDTSMDAEQVFEHLAALGDGQSSQGLGLYSSESQSRPSSRLARSEAETDSACSHQSSFLDTSTLASSYAPTPGFGRSTNSFKALGREESPSTSPLFVRRMANSTSPISPPAMIYTSGPDTASGIPATLGSPFSLYHEFPPSPASLSPFSFTESPRHSPTLASQSLAENSNCPSSNPSPVSPLSRSSSRQDFGFAELHQASVGLLGSFDMDGIPMWEVGEGDNYGRTVQSKQDEDENKLEILQDLTSPSPLRSECLSPNAPTSPLGTLRRLSSFQILRRRKSDNVLAANPPHARPMLTKPKSEAALSTLARRQEALFYNDCQHENRVMLEAQTSRSRISLRSRSTPRLSRPAAEPAKSRYTTSVPPGAKASKGSVGRSRFSIFGTKHSSQSPTEAIPPVPTTPTDHLAPIMSESPFANTESSIASLPTSPVSLALGDKPIGGESMTLANFLGSTSPKGDFAGKDSTKCPLGDRTNWSRPTSPALLDALKPSAAELHDLITVPQRIAVFPLRLPPAPQQALEAAKKQEEKAGNETAQDSYGDESDSAEDRPLGVTVPGALMAQKSLRKTMSSKKAKKSLGQTVDTRNTANRSQDSGDIAREATNKGSQGHDSFLPQSDASIARKASSNGLRRSPSTPLDPMIADSALTIDSPLLSQEPLPNPARRSSRAAATTSNALSSPPVAPPRSRPPPVPSRSFRQGDEDVNQAAPTLDRRPSLLPDVAQLQISVNMQRQASNSSSQSSARSTPSVGLDVLPPQQRTTNAARIRPVAALDAALPAIDYRVYLGRPGAKHLTIKVTDRTVGGEIVAYAKARGALEGGEESEGGWALWEIWRSLGLSRPVREYELLNDLIKSFDGDSGVFVLRRATLWPILSAHARPQPIVTKLAQVQLELKQGKWSKRYLELRDGALSHSKSEKGKDSSILCQLSNFSVFYVDEPTTLRLKAPRPFVFALKSRLTRANFEEVSQYCNFVSVKSIEDLNNWITSITEAGNPLFRQREQAISQANLALAVKRAPSTANPSHISQEVKQATGPSATRGFLARTTSSRPAPAILAPAQNENTPPARRPTISKPLVDLSR